MRPCGPEVIEDMAWGRGQTCVSEDELGQPGLDRQHQLNSAGSRTDKHEVLCMVMRAYMCTKPCTYMCAYPSTVTEQSLYSPSRYTQPLYSRSLYSLSRYSRPLYSPSQYSS